MGSAMVVWLVTEEVWIGLDWIGYIRFGIYCFVVDDNFGVSRKRDDGEGNLELSFAIGGEEALVPG